MNSPVPGEWEHSRLQWRTEFEHTLLEQVPSIQIVGAQAVRIWNTVSVIMPEADCQRRPVVKLDRLGFAVSTGSACSSGHETPSHVLLAMGHSPVEAGRALRFSSGWETCRDDWVRLAAAVVQSAGETLSALQG